MESEKKVRLNTIPFRSKKQVKELEDTYNKINERLGYKRYSISVNYRALYINIYEREE